MTTPTKKSLDQEHSTNVIYEFGLTVPHITLDEDTRALIRETFETFATTIRAQIEFAQIDPDKVSLRAHRRSQEFGRLDIFDPQDYPKE